MFGHLYDDGDDEDVVVVVVVVHPYTHRHDTLTY